MSRVGFELTILAFEQTKTVRALDRAATVIGGLQVCVRIKHGRCITMDPSHVKAACTPYQKTTYISYRNCDEETIVQTELEGATNLYVISRVHSSLGFFIK
jgi:hypothetical protein